MGLPYSLFREMDPPSKPLNFIPNPEYECRKDDSCGAVGNFLLWYFVIMLFLMILYRASLWMSEKKDASLSPDIGTSGSGYKDAYCKRHSKNTIWESFRKIFKKKPKHMQLSPVTDSEVALVNAYLERRRARLHSQLNQMNQGLHDSDTTDRDSMDSNSGASSWKESETEHHPTPASLRRRKIAQRQRNLGSYQIRERPCLHCKAMRTSEWLTRHFLHPPTAPPPVDGDIPEENSLVEINTKFSRI
ncbi:serine-rich single-pass membrane protein 1 [Antechinus flavipes]|uniref:serine-rich single-pass membrane protein 1 n=1 Tax=Antechinus flavipes TaxID=38775 RepID=UPI002235A466|nr:serine-rich single-pass membrane protein 1 [Antechinus flavipes]